MLNQPTTPPLSFALNNDRITRLLFVCAVFLFASLILFFLVNQLDTRILDGMPVWHKPIRFGLSLLIHFMTLAVLCQQIDEKYRAKYRFAFFAYAAAYSMWLEYCYISIQAARGRRSHFNFETDFESIMYMVMGIGALMLVLVSFVLGILIWRNGIQNKSGLRLGSILGLIIGSILTLIFAGFMSNSISYAELRLLNTPNLVPYLGWSRVSGDYKPAHFVATHMMQLLPLIGWLADKYNLTATSKINARKLVVFSALFFILLATIVFAMAVKGVPLFPA